MTRDSKYGYPPLLHERQPIQFSKIGVTEISHNDNFNNNNFNNNNFNNNNFNNNNSKQVCPIQSNQHYSNKYPCAFKNFH